MLFCLTLRIQATLPHPRGIFKASNPIRISGYLRIVLLILRVDIILVSKRIPNHQVTTTIYYSWRRGRFLDFLGSLNPFISPGDLHTLGDPPIPIAALQLHPRLLALPSPSEGKLHHVVPRPSTREPNDVARLLTDHLLQAIELLEGLTGWTDTHWIFEWWWNLEIAGRSNYD